MANGLLLKRDAASLLVSSRVGRRLLYGRRIDAFKVLNIHGDPHGIRRVNRHASRLLLCPLPGGVARIALLVLGRDQLFVVPTEASGLVLAYLVGGCQRLLNLDGVVLQLTWVQGRNEVREGLSLLLHAELKLVLEAVQGLVGWAHHRVVGATRRVSR